MKKIITYEIFGQVERSSYFKVGKALMRVEFKGGSINSAGLVPATFVTDNSLLQKAIENSDAFRSGQIKRGKVEELAEPSDAPVGDNEEKGNSFPDVTNMQQARTLLMAEPYSLSLSELQTKAAIKKKAEECGILFPNWL